MFNDIDPRQKTAHTEDDDDERTEGARRVVEDYASELREMIHKLRRWFS